MEALILVTKLEATMAHIAGKDMPAIGLILRALEENGVGRTIICTPGPADELQQYCMLDHPNLFYRFISDDSDPPGGTSYSVYLAHNELDPKEPLLIINGNVAFEPGLLAPVVDQPRSGVAVDWGSFDERSYHVSIRDGHVLSIASDQFAEESFGRCVGVYKFVPEDAQLLVSEIVRSVDSYGERAQPLEALLDRLFLSGVLHAYPCKIENAGWIVVPRVLADGDASSGVSLPSTGP